MKRAFNHWAVTFLGALLALGVGASVMVLWWQPASKADPGRQNWVVWFDGKTYPYAQLPHLAKRYRDSVTVDHPALACYGIVVMYPNKAVADRFSDAYTALARKAGSPVPKSTQNAAVLRASDQANCRERYPHRPERLTFAPVNS